MLQIAKYKKYIDIGIEKKNNFNLFRAKLEKPTNGRQKPTATLSVDEVIQSDTEGRVREKKSSTGIGRKKRVERRGARTAAAVLAKYPAVTRK